MFSTLQSFGHHVFHVGGPSGRTKWLVTFPVCSGRRLLSLFETQNGRLICQEDLSVRGMEQVARTALPFIVVLRFRGLLLLSSPPRRLLPFRKKKQRPIAQTIDG